MDEQKKASLTPLQTQRLRKRREREKGGKYQKKVALE